MSGMKRLYYPYVLEHLEDHDQMIFLMGPRQVGKTTLAKDLLSEWGRGDYLSWDNSKHRRLILEGPDQVAEELGVHEYGDQPPLVVFDEIQKYSDWKNYLKGFYDTYKGDVKIVVTGSSKLDVFIKGGDSLMGRYFVFRIHPFTVAEVMGNHFMMGKKEFNASPKLPQKKKLQNLLNFGGFPDPFIKGDRPFYNRWNRMRSKQVFQEDIRDFKHLQEVTGVETLAMILQEQVGQLVAYSTLSKKIGMATDKTIKEWIEILKSLYFFFEVRPYHRNVTKSLIKQPKLYLWDWSLCTNEGALAENFVASHLLKAVHFWNDLGIGDYTLHFIRDRSKREVDFLITKEKEPWILIEVKNGESKSLSPSLLHYHEELQTRYAFQVSLTKEGIQKSPLLTRKPTILPAVNLLSELF